MPFEGLLAHDSDSDEAARRFIREAQIAGRIKHPNVVEVYDICQQDSAVFLVMELLEGESLAARLERVGRLAVPEALQIMIGSMDGLAAAHEAGVVHRDIKPANIFLCKGRHADDVQPKVVDFGVSCLIARPGLGDPATTRSGTVIGTPHYMAPEQMRAAAVDGRADVYALGVTLYEMLAGVRPYNAATYPELVLQIAAGQARSLREVAPKLPRELCAIVSRAMAPDPADRFPSVAAMRQALLPLMAADTSERSPRRTRWVVLATVLAVVASVATSGSDLLGDRERDSRPQQQPDVAPPSSAADEAAPHTDVDRAAAAGSGEPPVPVPPPDAMKSPTSQPTRPTQVRRPTSRSEGPGPSAPRLRVSARASWHRVAHRRSE